MLEKQEVKVIYCNINLRLAFFCPLLSFYRMDISILNCLSWSHFKVNRIYFWQFIHCRLIAWLLSMSWHSDTPWKCCNIVIGVKTSCSNRLFYIPHFPQPPVSSAFFQATRMDLLSHAYTALHSAHHTTSTSELLLLVSLAPTCPFLNALTEASRIIHPSHAHLRFCLPTTRKQRVPLAAVTIPSTKPSYSVWQLSPHLLPWRFTLSCNSGYCIFPIRELNSSEATAIAHAKYFSH